MAGPGTRAPLGVLRGACGTQRHLPQEERGSQRDGGEHSGEDEDVGGALRHRALIRLPYRGGKLRERGGIEGGGPSGDGAALSGAGTRETAPAKSAPLTATPMEPPRVRASVAAPEAAPRSSTGALCREMRIVVWVSRPMPMPSAAMQAPEK